MIHIENSLTDPTTDESLHLVRRGICRQQNTLECTRPPITINRSRILKSQLRSSQMSLLEQRLLWTALTLSFYGFLHASESLIVWSNITLYNVHISITLRQSKTVSFRRGQSIHICATSTTTCPVRAMQNCNNMVTTKQPYHLIFLTGTILSLSRSRLTTILRQLLSQAGFCSSHYTSHSFRIGAATTAAAVWLTPSLIKTLGRWNSNAYMAYIRCPESVIATIPQRLSTASVSADYSWNPDL